MFIVVINAHSLSVQSSIPVGSACSLIRHVYLCLISENEHNTVYTIIHYHKICHTIYTCMIVRITIRRMGGD